MDEKYREELEHAEAVLQKAAMQLRDRRPWEADACERAALRVAKTLDEAASE